MDHLLHCRSPTPDDFSFILNSWLRSYSRSDHVRQIASEVYYYSHSILIKEILKVSRTIVAVSTEDPTQIFGYLTYIPDYLDHDFVVHYLYVKQPYRRFGIAKKLLQTMKSAEHPHIDAEDATMWFTHYTSYSKYFMKDNYFQFNPYLIKGIDYAIKSFSLSKARNGGGEDGTLPQI